MSSFTTQAPPLGSCPPLQAARAAVCATRGGCRNAEVPLLLSAFLGRLDTAEVDEMEGGGPHGLCNPAPRCRPIMKWGFPPLRSSTPRSTLCCALPTARGTTARPGLTCTMPGAPHTHHITLTLVLYRLVSCHHWTGPCRCPTTPKPVLAMLAALLGGQQPAWRRSASAAALLHQRLAHRHARQRPSRGSSEHELARSHRPRPAGGWFGSPASNSVKLAAVDTAINPRDLNQPNL